MFIAYLTNDQKAYDIQSIETYLTEAKQNSTMIYASSLTLAEILPSKMGNGGFSDFTHFTSDFEGSVILVDPNPNIMALAGRLRDLPYKKGTSTSRKLDTPDAITLATALYLQNALGIELDAFHTFDNGKKKGPEGKCVPILSFEEWCQDFDGHNTSLASEVIDLPRRRPIHSSPNLPGF